MLQVWEQRSPGGDQGGTGNVAQRRLLQPREPGSIWGIPREGPRVEQGKSVMMKERWRGGIAG